MTHPKTLLGYTFVKFSHDVVIALGAAGRGTVRINLHSYKHPPSLYACTPLLGSLRLGFRPVGLG